jgi:hypothetical protein
MRLQPAVPGDSIFERDFLRRIDIQRAGFEQRRKLPMDSGAFDGAYLQRVDTQQARAAVNSGPPTASSATFAPRFPLRSRTAAATSEFEDSISIPSIVAASRSTPSASALRVRANWHAARPTDPAAPVIRASRLYSAARFR